MNICVIIPRLRYLLLASFVHCFQTLSQLRNIFSVGMYNIQIHHQSFLFIDARWQEISKYKVK